jgi:hypothetical protein
LTFLYQLRINLLRMLPFSAMKNAIAVLLLFLTQLSQAAPTNKQKEVAEGIANLLGKGQYESVRKYFDPQLKQNLSAAAIEQTWSDLIAQTGEFDRVLKSQSGSAQGFDVVEILCATNQAGIVVRVVFRPGSSLANGLWVKPAQPPAQPPGQPQKKEPPGFPQ